MVKPANHWRLVAVALAFAAAAAVLTPSNVCAQPPREGRGEWRRDGRPRGERRSEREAAASSASPTASAPTANPAPSSFGTVTDAERIRKLAADTVKRNDKNGNGILEGDELDNLRMSRAADTSGDGKITYDELVAFYSPKATTSNPSQPTAQPTASSTGTTAAAADKPDERKIVNTSRKTYRFKSTKDRQSSWRFSSRDANGDGQVSMSEYSRTWNDRTAAEFQRYDRNNDGMITPDEAK